MACRLNSPKRAGAFRRLPLLFHPAALFLCLLLASTSAGQPPPDAEPPAIDPDSGAVVAPFTPAGDADGAEPPVDSSTEPEPPGEKGDYFLFEAYWREGIQYELKERIHLFDQSRALSYGFAEDTLVSGKIGFRLAVDAAGYVAADGLDNIDEDIDTRRSFLNLSGDFFLFYPASFRLEFGVITGDFFLRQSWFQWRQLPYVGNLRFGQFTGPLTLEGLGSGDDTMFMETASPVQAFSSGIKAGIQVFDNALDERLTWAIGWFADAEDSDIGDSSDSFARFIGRVTWLARDPRLQSDSEDRQLLHLGMSSSYTFSAQESVRYRARPESFLAPHLVDTGELDADSSWVVGTEAVWVNGPLSVQSEVLYSLVDDELGDRNFWGAYGYVSWALTGESRADTYKRERGLLRRIEPARPLSFHEKRWGALELAARYSFIDLKDGPIRGGRMHMLSNGLNWYWNRYIRWQLNYNLANIHQGLDDGLLHVFQLRFQMII
jgi:phosphate-selective porin OprO/OprP